MTAIHLKTFLIFQHPQHSTWPSTDTTVNPLLQWVASIRKVAGTENVPGAVRKGLIARRSMRKSRSSEGISLDGYSESPLGSPGKSPSLRRVCG